jgi:16S rRNA (cytidine1402-2'-O)-methyltransferase
MKRKGTLYLLPMPLGEEWEGSLSERALSLLKSLDYFVTEYPRTARRFITQFRDVHPLTFEELNKRTPDRALQPWIDRLESGLDIGYMSEAGMPCIADPGKRLVRAAHAQRITVVPVPGSSAILLALVGSGLNGQGFTFHGYLSPKKSGREKELKALAQTAERTGLTQIFMETPYRNEQLLESAFAVLPPDILLSISANLTQPDEYVKTLPIAAWKKAKRPNLHKIPTVFCVGFR